MTEDRLLELIEAWGADPAAYPEADRAAARALLAQQPERFAAALAAARDLDAALTRVPAVLPSKALEDRLAASGPKPRGGRSQWRWPMFAPWAPASGLAALAAGVFMGFTVAPAAVAESDTDEVAAVLEHALGYDPADISEVIGE
jgi:hypothetical protein